MAAAAMTGRCQRAGRSCHWLEWPCYLEPSQGKSWPQANARWPRHARAPPLAAGKLPRWPNRRPLFLSLLRPPQRSSHVAKPPPSTTGQVKHTTNFASPCCTCCTHPRPLLATASPATDAMTAAVGVARGQGARGHLRPSCGCSKMRPGPGMLTAIAHPSSWTTVPEIKIFRSPLLHPVVGRREQNRAATGCAWSSNTARHAPDLSCPAHHHYGRRRPPRRRERQEPFSPAQCRREVEEKGIWCTCLFDWQAGPTVQRVPHVGYVVTDLGRKPGVPNKYC
jgi:hypothetical protein